MTDEEKRLAAEKAFNDKLDAKLLAFEAKQDFTSPTMVKEMFAEEIKAFDNVETVTTMQTKLDQVVAASVAQGELVEKIKADAMKPEDSFTKAFNENKDKFEAATKGNFDKFSMELKSISASSFTDMSAGFENTYISEKVKGMPFLFELFDNSIPVPVDNRGSIKYTEQLTNTSNADSVAENAVPSEDSMTWVEKSLDPAKIKAIIKVSTDQLYDVNYLRAQVQKNLMKGWILKVQDLLLNGEEAGNDPNGLLNQATAFDAAGFVTSTGGAPDPWLLDLINAMWLQITEDGKNEADPSITFLRNTLLHQIKTKKDSNKNYMNLNWAMGAPMNISGMKVLGNQLAGSNEIVVGDLSKAQLYIWDSMTLDIFQEKDDRSKDLVTMMVKGRMNLVVPSNDQYAIVKSTDASGDITAIEYVGE
jgi:hypothetical protein